tara:strand:+ start:118 stop:735 length:618 start_codon:yes stop_codon:yes gene_type:complete
MKLKINEINLNQENPRTIKAVKFKKLVKSVKELPQMLDMRPIIVDEKRTILGGNMRYRACVEAGLKEVPVFEYTKKHHKTTDAFKLHKKTYEETCQEIVVKDNVSFGEWDWDILGNDYSFNLLDEWSVDLPSGMFREEPDYSILENENFDEELDTMEKDVRRALQIPFEAKDYEEAKELYRLLVGKGAYVGGLLLDLLRLEKDSL